MLPVAAYTQTVFVDPVLDAALPRVTIEHLRPVLDQDIERDLKAGDLSPCKDCGFVVGVVQHGVRRVYVYGGVKENSVFEIGSITKTFTGLILAQMVGKGKARMDDPVRAYLPDGVVRKLAGEEITIRDLTTQHSDLPPQPDNLNPADPNNPFADYGSRELYAYLGKPGVQHASQAPYVYSNTGVKLLALALSLRAGMPYDSLLHQQVTEPLGMRDTSVALCPDMARRVARGHDEDFKPVEAWTFADLPGAGGIHSTAGDMLTYIEAQLHPERIHAPGPGETLPAAVTMTHQLLAVANPGMHIAMNWHHSDSDGNYQHGGRTGGFTSYAIFNVEQDFGVVVLSNLAASRESLAVRLADHISQRLMGLPAISLLEKR